MKVREENADLINFYLKQGTNCQKPQGISLEKKQYSLSLQCFPIRKGRNFSMFMLLFFSNISQCYKITHLNFCLDRLALSILRFLEKTQAQGTCEHGVFTLPLEQKVALCLLLSRKAEMKTSAKYTVLKSCHFHGKTDKQTKLKSLRKEQESLPSVQDSKWGSM